MDAPFGSNFQPARRAVEEARAEVQRDGEQSIGDADTQLGNRAADRAHTGGGVVECEAQIVNPGRGIHAFREPALIGEGGALREGGGGETQRERAGRKVTQEA